MESSSEDNFAWTDTSSDQSENGVMANEQESDFDKSFKRKLQKELFKNGDHSEPAADEPRVKKKKKIKREPSSPSPVKRETNGHDAAAAERYLRLQVKQEQAATPATPASPATPSTSATPATRGKRARAAARPTATSPRGRNTSGRAERDSAGTGVDAEEPQEEKEKNEKGHFRHRGCGH
ncbi:uncharacterized protein [Choristoneura fumiferana]|uniref:uncharacterized protein n=1 Tax=Choristoneura fumiferana TaxID=7141 RepID=UPI003D159D2D